MRKTIAATRRRIASALTWMVVLSAGCGGRQRAAAGETTRAATSEPMASPGGPSSSTPITAAVATELDVGVVAAQAEASNCPPDSTDCGDGQWCCPSDAPLCCGNGKCCPSGRPWACPSQGKCYEDEEEAQAQCDAIIMYCR
ncbi:MAG TPA: hypothetical protein VHE35_01820 [Kofleriaceae bacterium]|nr:hypothetical protein [Kofleriaceae bacterium]